ncbi:hypothetical protein [Rathayibacter rathayi]|uniref:hypothetical protein n=1 Tax=Rathayibacter rathayi TaxID=33887 RepID=UPI000BC73CA0|nr:hypothetical protein [Rathayibacter rathayi]MWV75862.1 hypothetical protein [Rathayibacter rathayi NCPPB 2980 = VKM Ac-1601]TWD63576.1 hypothetical protein FB469_3145 [Rathayibacter rathayi]SOE05868.1 hypothetical protein SAMN06295924_11631 [Rathayibacter rathayi NCPPB 2980 = VKM Ac-1601]
MLSRFIKVAGMTVLLAGTVALSGCSSSTSGDAGDAVESLRAAQEEIYEGNAKIESIESVGAWKYGDGYAAVVKFTNDPNSYSSSDKAKYDTNVNAESLVSYSAAVMVKDDGKWVARNGGAIPAKYYPQTKPHRAACFALNESQGLATSQCESIDE